MNTLDLRPKSEAERPSPRQSTSGRVVSSVGNVVSKVDPVRGGMISTAGAIIGSVTSPLKAAKEKFGTTTVYMMLGTAIFFDLLIAVIDILDTVTFGLASFIFGSLFDFLALMTLTFMFKIKGGSLGRRRALSFGMGLVLKFIPLIDLLPDWTLAVMLSFLQESMEAAKKK